MYGCESWTIKKAECWRIDAFELWCWRRLLRVPWTTRRSNQSILKEINSEYSLERLMLKLKLQYLGHLVWTADSLAKTPYWERLKAEGEENDRGWGGWMALPVQWTWTWASSRRWWGTGRLGVLQSRRSQSQTWLGDWTTTSGFRGWGFLRGMLLLQKWCSAKVWAQHNLQSLSYASCFSTSCNESSSPEMLHEESHCRLMPWLQSCTPSPSEVHGKESKSACGLSVSVTPGAPVFKLSHTQHFKFIKSVSWVLLS